MNALVHTSNSLTTDLEFSSDQVNIIKNVICPGIKDTELSYCLEVAGRLGANPILKEVHFIFQNVQGGRKVMVQLGIDFYRRRAMETGRLRGKEIEVCGEDGVWHDILPAGKKLYAARCTLYVEGMDIPIRRIAYWREFGEPNANNPIWRTKSIHMLTKVAESHAIRDMCAGQLGGTVTEDEVDAGDSVAVTQAKATPTPRPSLPAPTPAQPAQEQPPAPNPEEAKRKVLATTIRGCMKDVDQNDPERVRATVSSMANPGPYAQKWPAFDKWTTEQLEDLVRLYDDLADAREAAEQQAEEEAQEAQEAEVSPSEPSQEQAEDTSLADELGPARPETGDDGKPKAPF